MERGIHFCQFPRPPSQKMAIWRPPIQHNGMFEALPIQKMHFLYPTIQQNGILDTPYQTYFPSPLKPKMAEIRPPIQKMTKLGQNWPIFYPPYKNGQNLTPPIQKWSKFDTPSTKNALISRSPIELFYPPYKKLTPLYNKMVFLRPHYTKNGIFETPLYNKMPYSRPPFTKMHFREYGDKIL